MLLIYIEPLCEDAGFIFICKHLDYFGEPAVCIMIAVVAFINATLIWVFGQYGQPLGLAGAVYCAATLQQKVTGFFYMTTFKNPCLSDEQKKQRAQHNDIIGNEGPTSFFSTFCLRIGCG